MYFVSIVHALYSSGAQRNAWSSVADPDPSDPYVFGPPGSRSYHQAKIVRKTLIPTALRLSFDFLSLKNDVNVPSKRNKQKSFLKK